MASGRKTQVESTESSGSGGRSSSTSRRAVRTKSRSTSRGATAKSPGRREASRSRSRGRPPSATSPPARTKSPAPRQSRKKSPAPSPKAKASKSPQKGPQRRAPSKSPARSPAKSSAKQAPKKAPAQKSPARKSPARKSPARRSPAKKSPDSAEKRTAGRPRKSSKSPSRIPIASASGRGRSVTPPAKEREVANRKSGATPPRVPAADRAASTSWLQGTPKSPVRRRSVLSSTAETSTAGGNSVFSSHGPSGERRFQGTEVLYEEERTSTTTRPLSSAVRASPRIANLRTFSSEDQVGEGASSKHQLEGSSKAGKDADQGRLARLKAKVKSFGYGITLASLLWFFLTPAMVVVVYLLCNKDRCTVLKMPVLPDTVGAYLKWKLFPAYGVFLAAQALLQALPVGRTVYGFPSKIFKHHVAFQYRLNGWVNLLGTCAAFGVLLYYRFPMTIPYRYSFQLLMTALVYAVVLSVFLYIKGIFATRNHKFPYGNTGNILNDFVVGRELAPRIGELYDLATLSFRCGLLSWAWLLGSMAWHEYDHHGCLDYNFAVTVVCQLLYICVIMLDEEYFLGAVFVTEDSLGFVAVVSNLVVVPFFGILPAKFLLEHRQSLPLYCLASIALVFLVGLATLHLSQKRKHFFRRNWPDPSIRGHGLDYLIDKSGNKLLVSGLWGFVRHPNYLGDLLCTLAVALPCGFRHVLPYYTLLLCVVMLVARSVQVDSKCRQRYGDLWVHYTQRVKYRLIPYVF